jgi:predicted TIM-barrel fold metal-dependent hydrolase
MAVRLPFVVHSSDCHVVEPPDLWTPRIDKKWLGREPRIQHLEDTDIWVVDKDVRMAVVGIQDQAGFRFEDPTKISKKARMDDLARGNAGWEPLLYMKGMDEDGVYGAVIYPSEATQAFRVIRGELLDALSATYNDWMMDEFCMAAPERLKCVAMINVDDVDVAVKEMYRTAKKKTCAAHMLPVFPAHPKTYDMPEFDPIWAAAEEIGLPIVFHLGTNKKAFSHEPALDLVVHATKDIHIQRSLASIVMGGVFTRHPKAKCGAIEFGASWLAPLMLNCDRLMEEYEDELPKYPDGEKPSDHFRRNVFASFQDDPAAIELRDIVGVENLQWGNDYPHAEATFPFSHKFLQSQLEGVPDEEAAMIAGGNTAKMYGFAEPSEEAKKALGMPEPKGAML